MKKCFVKKLISCPVSFSVRFGTTARRRRHPVIKDAEGGESALFFLHMHPPLALLPQHFLLFFPLPLRLCQPRQMDVRRRRRHLPATAATSQAESGSSEQPQSQDAATGGERQPTYITPPPPVVFAQQMEGWVVEGRRGGHVSVRL